MIENTRRMGEAGGRSGGRPRGLGGIEPRLFVGDRGVRAIVKAAAGDAVEHATVCVLHLQQPVELPLELVEQIRNAVAAFGDVGVVAEGTRPELKRPEQVKQRGLEVRHIHVGVACVVPTAEQVARPALGLTPLRVSGRSILIGTKVTAPVMPVPTVTFA